MRRPVVAERPTLSVLLAVEQLLGSADGTAFRFRHALTREALLAGHDPVVDAALEWIQKNTGQTREQK